MTKSAFGTALRRVRPNIEDKQRTVAGKVQWCYVGIGMVQVGGDGESGAELPSQTSRTSRTFPLSFSRTREEDCGVNGKAGVENIEAKSVKSVKSVNDCGRADVAETPTHDGYVNRECRDCGAWLSCCRQEQPE
jgi:hypothetical protein